MTPDPQKAVAFTESAHRVLVSLARLTELAEALADDLKTMTDAARDYLSDIVRDFPLLDQDN